MENELDNTKTAKKNLEEKHEAHVKKAEEDKQKAKNEYDNLKKDFMHAEVEWKNTLNE